MEKLKRKLLQLSLVVVVLFSCTAGIFAQRITVSGKITDADQRPVTGANIVVKGTMDGTISNATGDYSIQALPDAILEFSFIGMVRQEIPVSNRTTINVVMAYDAIGLEEVVAVGYGVMRKADLTSAISKVDGALLHNQPVASPASLLIGKSTGVHVITNSGAPGASATVRIRGAASLASGGNDPLYVVDGVPTDNILGINPNDIESIEVLKDASSSAIYGSRAANGVILITTARGRAGVTKYSIDSYYGFNRVYKRMEMMNAQEQFEYVQKGVENFNRINPNNPVQIRPGAIADYEAGYDTDWQEEVFRTAPVQNYSFSANGGTDRLIFSSNIGYFNQQGVIISNGYERYTGRFSMDFALNNWLSIGASLRGNYSVTDEIPSGDSQSSIMANLQRKLPYEPVYEPDGSYANRERPNLVAVAKEFEGESSQIAGIGSVYATFHIIEGLDFKTFLASDFYNNTGNSFYPSLILGGATRPTSAYSNKGNTWLNENVLSYTLRTDRISLTSILGYSAQENSSFNFNAAASGGPTDLIPTMNAAPLKEVANSTTSGWGITSLFSRVNFSYDGRYLTSLSFRRDGSSRFGSDNRYAFFPAASVAWRISSEDFMDNLTNLDELKLRTSFGRTGNQNIGNYVAQGTYNTGANYAGLAGVQAGGIPSSALSWETTDQIDIGFDLVMFRSRIDFSADFYRKNTYGLLFSMPLPNYTGFGSYWTNLGKIENRGMEYSLNADLIRGNNFNWSAGFNISFNQNKVLELPNGTPILNSSATGVYYTTNAGFRTEEGLPIGQFYGLKWTGEVYPTNEDALAHVTTIMGQPAVGGTLKYEDFNEDGVINANDRQILGSPHPDFFGGFNSQMSFRSFDLGMQVSYVYGNMIFNQMRFLGSRGFIYDAALKERVNAWGYPGHITTEHKAMHGTDARDNQFSSRYLEDGSYLRLNNITLGYTLPQSVSQNINLNSLRIYLSAQNLLTITNYRGWDPEVNAKPGDIRTQGVDIGMIPHQSAFLLGLNVNF